MEKKSHHYVPKFYLRNFSINKKSIGMYVKKSSLYIKRASIKDQACKDFLYGEDKVIEDALMEIETKVSVIINNIIQTTTLPEFDSQDYHTLLLFILISENRVLKQADSYENLITEQTKVMAKMYKEHGRLDVPDEIIERINVSQKIPNLLPLQTASKMYPILLDLKLSILISNNDRTFITSDNPVVKYNYFYRVRDYRLRGYGLGNMGIQIFFPISPKYCLYLYDSVMYHSVVADDGHLITIKKGKQIDELNKLFYMNSYNYTYFHETTNESYINRLVEELRYIDDSNKEVSTFGDPANNILIFYHPRQVEERFKLTFLTINPELLKMPLPGHMGGPLRPIAKEFEKEKDDAD